LIYSPAEGRALCCGPTVSPTLVVSGKLVAFPIQKSKVANDFTIGALLAHRATTNMASQSPDTAANVKSEEAAIADSTMEESEVKMETDGPELSNELLKTMKGIVDYLTEYRDEK